MNEYGRDEDETFVHARDQRDEVKRRVEEPDQDTQIGVLENILRGTHAADSIEFVDRQGQFARALGCQFAPASPVRFDRRGLSLCSGTTLSLSSG